MKKLTFLCLAFISVCAFAGRTETLLTDWQFCMEQQPNTMPEFGWQQVTIPHDWAITGPFSRDNDLQNVAITQNGSQEPSVRTGRTGGLPYVGAAWYRTTLRPPFADNVTLHDESFSEEEINEACRYVNADSFISRLPKGIHEELIEKGENLSQGQRQLLSFARTVIHKPQILILDEATANIDTETEVLIQQSLEKMKSIGTMLVVAHRLSTIQHADQIIVLQNGEIVEKGDHQQLLKNRGYYYKLYQLQFEN